MNVGRLVKKAQRGNKKALLNLITAQKADYYKLAYTYMGNEVDAMDAMSEMIVIVYEKIVDLEKPDVFYTWSKTILVNCCKGLLRKQKNLILIDEWTSKYDSTIHHDNKLWVETEELLAVLNEEQRDAILLKYFHDMDYETIATMTGVPKGTVKSRVYYGLEKMKNMDRGIENESN